MANNPPPPNQKFFLNDPLNPPTSNSLFNDLDQPLFNNSPMNAASQRMMPSIPTNQQPSVQTISSLLSNQNNSPSKSLMQNPPMASNFPQHEIQTHQMPLSGSPIIPNQTMNQTPIPPNAQYPNQNDSNIPSLPQLQQIHQSPNDQKIPSLPPMQQFPQFPQPSNQRALYSPQQFSHIHAPNVPPPQPQYGYAFNISQHPGYQKIGQMPPGPTALSMGPNATAGMVRPPVVQMPFANFQGQMKPPPINYPFNPTLVLNTLKQVHANGGAGLDKLSPQLQMFYAQMFSGNKSNSSHKKSGRSGDDFITNDYDEDEPADDIESSEEGSFYSSSDTDTNFEELPDDFVPENIVAEKRTNLRDRKNIKHEDSEDYDFDFEEEVHEKKQAIVSEDLLEHIYMSRIKDGSLEYLVRFQESPPALCHWVPECLVVVIPNANRHLAQFRTDPILLTDQEQSDIYPVAHRRDTPNSRPELLFRFAYENTILFYWDLADEKTMKNYFDHCIRIDESEPEIPTTPLPEPDNKTIVSKTNETMRDYQVDGLKWLIGCWKDHHGSILADEMGLGKTIQLLSFLTYLNKNTEWKGPYLISVRTNTFKQWCEEIEKWTDFKYLPYNSSPAQRAIMREHQFPALNQMGDPIPHTYAFHIFLVSYDVLLKDVDFISSIKWQVLVVDEGHRIKNSQGKKNNAMSSVNALHRIILTGTPIQNSLTELWTLLRFVSPTYFEEDPEFIENDLEGLAPEEIIETRKMIEPHLLRRSLSEVEHSIAPKEERVAFVSLTPVQKDLIRLTKLHKLWRLKGIQTSEEEMDASNEGIAILKICSHPFLLPEAEEYYSKKFSMSRRDLILHVSAKFQWLDRLLRVLKREGHRVLIFSQRVELLRLLHEFCTLSHYVSELFIGSMSDSDKTSAIERFSAQNSNTFIFLISTRAGSEGLNLTVANTAIIFDPDWNPQNDLQAQARCHRIGQTQKVDVLRLITYQTYEHEMFVRAQKKLGLWLTILGSKSLDEVTYQKEGLDPVEKPPDIEKVEDNPDLSLDATLHNTSTIVHDFSLDCLQTLEEPLNQTLDYKTSILSDDSFIESFPVSVDSGSRRTKHSRSHDNLLDYTTALDIYKLFEKYGYGEWKLIAHELTDEYTPEQVRRFCVCLTIFAFRSMQPQNIVYFPVLIANVLPEEPDFDFEKLLCSNKSAWAEVFPEDHDYALEVESCKKLRNELKEDAFSFLSIIEMRLIAKSWCLFNNKETFDIDTLSPPVTDNDQTLFEAICDYHHFDPFDYRVQAIINKMRSDIITAKLFDFAFKFQWWSQYEFENIISVLKNFKYEYPDFTVFHARTTILSKITEEVESFTLSLKSKIITRSKGSITIPKEMHHMYWAPKALQNSKGFSSWTQILVRDCEDVVFRWELIDLILLKIQAIPDTAEESDERWTEQHTKRFLLALLEHGIDSLADLLLDRRYGFKKFLSPSDIEYLNGTKKRRTAGTSTLPDFLFNEDELYAYLTTNKDEVPSDDGLVHFHNPATEKVLFEVNKQPKRKVIKPTSRSPAKHDFRNQDEMSYNPKDDDDDLNSYNSRITRSSQKSSSNATTTRKSRFVKKKYDDDDFEDDFDDDDDIEDDNDFQPDED